MSLPTISELMAKTNWTDPNVDIYIGEVVEYDMHDAGFSIIQQHRLLPEDEIEAISKIKDKHERHVRVGNTLRGVKGLSATLNDAFKYYRMKFGIDNELLIEDVLSIKKDAIFVKKYCYQLSFGRFIEFREKNVYYAFLRISKIECYWNHDKIDIKGVSDDVIERYHRDYTCKVIWQFMKYLSEFDNIKAVKYIVKMMEDYKNFKLSAGYYRTFNGDSKYPLSIPGATPVLAEEVGDSMLRMCNIEFNYRTVYIPLLNIATMLNQK